MQNDTRGQKQVSVLITTCNGENWIAEQIVSILDQSYQNIEIVVCDDASTDSTLNIVSELLVGTKHQILGGRERIGVNRNIQRGLNACRGDYIAICDQDDIWLPEKIEVLLGAIGEASAVWCDSELIGAGGERLNDTLMNSYYKADAPTGRCPLKLFYKNAVSGHAMLFRRQLLDVALPLVEVPMYDQQLAIAAAISDGLSYEQSALTLHRQHADNQANKFITAAAPKNALSTSTRGGRQEKDRRRVENLYAVIAYALDVHKRISKSLDVECSADEARLKVLQRQLESTGALGRFRCLLSIIRMRHELFYTYRFPRNVKLCWSIYRGMSLNPVLHPPQKLV